MNIQQRLTINVLILSLSAPLNAGGCWSSPSDGPAQPAPRVAPAGNTVNVTVNNKVTHVNKVTNVIRVAAVTQVAHQTTQTNTATNLSSLPGIRGEPKVSSNSQSSVPSVLQEEAKESKQTVSSAEEYKAILLAAETAKKDLNEQDKKRLHVLYQEMSAPERSVIGQQYLAFQLKMTERAQRQALKDTSKKPRGRGQRTGGQQRPSKQAGRGRGAKPGSNKQQSLQIPGQDQSSRAGRGRSTGRGRRGNGKGSAPAQKRVN